VPSSLVDLQIKISYVPRPAEVVDVLAAQHVKIETVPGLRTIFTLMSIIDM
jgi:hypothetical protein